MQKLEHLVIIGILGILLVMPGCKKKSNAQFNPKTKTSQLSKAPKDSMFVTVMMPRGENGDELVSLVSSYGADTLKKLKYVGKKVLVPNMQDTIKASVQGVCELIIPNGGPPKTKIDYIKVKDTTVYIMLNIDEEGASWAGSSNVVAVTHTIIKKTLSQFPNIKNVVFNRMPDDKN